MKKRNLSDSEQKECAALKKIYEERKAEIGLTQQKAANSLGMTQSAVNHYLNGTNALNAVVASGFAKLLNVAVSDFSIRLAREIDYMADTVDSEKLAAYQKSTTDTTTLYLYDWSASCGHGVLNHDFPELLRTIEIPNDALQELLGTTNLKGVHLMPPDGDSMEPTIPRRSITLIKTDIAEFKSSGVYLITFDGYTYIKRLSRGKHGIIKVTSDNRSYAATDFEITPEEYEQLTVHGRFWKTLPLDFLDI